MRLFVGANINFIGKRKYAITFSIICILIGIVALFTRGGPNFGIDFTGGVLLDLRFDPPVGVVDIKNALSKAGITEVEVQAIGESGKDIMFRFQEDEKKGLSSDKVKEVLKSAFPDNIPVGEKEELWILQEEKVGPKIGHELVGKAIASIFWALLAIIIYIWIRFDFKYGIASVIALFHDVLFTFAFFTVFNWEISMPVVAGFLTLIGYSLNDTIVVFDRIRENLKSVRRAPYEEIINRSINETLSRTIVTGLTTLLVIIVLLIIDIETLREFTLTLFIGVIIGTYSSIFIASPIVIWWHHAFSREARLSLSKK